MTKPTTPHNIPVYIGIDFHKRYSVFCAIDASDRVLERGRIDHTMPELFNDLINAIPDAVWFSKPP